MKVDHQQMTRKGGLKRKTTHPHTHMQEFKSHIQAICMQVECTTHMYMHVLLFTLTVYTRTPNLPSHSNVEIIMYKSIVTKYAI